MGRMDEPEFQAAIAEALGPYAKSAGNPTGGEGYYAPAVEDEPYCVMYGVNAGASEFATAEEAITAAKWYRNKTDAELRSSFA